MCFYECTLSESIGLSKATQCACNIPRSSAMYLNIYQYQSNFRQYGFIVLRQMPPKYSVVIVIGMAHIIAYSCLLNIILYFQDIASLIQGAHHSYHIQTDKQKKKIVLQMFYAKGCSSILNSSQLLQFHFEVTTDSIHHNSF